MPDVNGRHVPEDHEAAMVNDDHAEDMVNEDISEDEEE